MKLAKYLADYLEHELNCNPDYTIFIGEKLIQQGIEAFASTEDMQVIVRTVDLTDRNCLREYYG